MEKWDIKTIEYLAMLSRLDLTQGEKEKFSKQLEKIVAHVEKLNELKTDNVEPTAHVLDINNVYREDIESPSIERSLMENIMPSGKDGFFKVPPVIE